MKKKKKYIYIYIYIKRGNVIRSSNDIGLVNNFRNILWENKKKNLTNFYIFYKSDINFF